MSALAIGIIVLAVLILIPMAVKILPEYERGIVFRLGRLIGVKGPGLFLIVPLIERMIKVDMRVVTMDLPPQKVVTRDNVNVEAGAVVKFRVVDPVAATVKILDHVRETSKVSQDALRNLLIQSERDELVHVDEVGKTLREHIERETIGWGVEVTGVELKKMYFAEDYACSVCGKEVAVTKSGSGTLVFCGQEMRKIG